MAQEPGEKGKRKNMAASRSEEERKLDRAGGKIRVGKWVSEKKKTEFASRWLIVIVRGRGRGASGLDRPHRRVESPQNLPPASKLEIRGRQDRRSRLVSRQSAF